MKKGHIIQTVSIRNTGVALLITDKISFKAKSISNVNMDIL